MMQVSRGELEQLAKELLQDDQKDRVHDAKDANPLSSALPLSLSFARCPGIHSISQSHSLSLSLARRPSSTSQQFPTPRYLTTRVALCSCAEKAAPPRPKRVVRY